MGLDYLVDEYLARSEARKVLVIVGSIRVPYLESSSVSK